MTTKQLIRDVIVICLVAFISFMLGAFVSTSELKLEHEAEIKHAIDSMYRLQGL